MSLKRSHPSMGSRTPQRLDRPSSIKIQKSYQLFYNTAKNEDKLKTYKKVKYQGIIYKLGEFLEIYHLGSNFPYVVKLTNIASLLQGEHSEEEEGKIDAKCPVIQVEWYLKKSDLYKNTHFNQWDKILSANEVFASGQTFVLPIESIMGKCQVLTVDEYSQLSFIENSIYFTRAAYDMETKKLSPEISQWPKKYCVCDSPYNPDMEYVQCEKCQKWYHNDCAIKESDDLSNFACSSCTKKDQLNKKKKK